MRVAQALTLAEEQRVTLVRWSRGRSTPARLVLRAQIALRAAEGMRNQDIARELDTDVNTVGRWRKRFAERGLDGIAKDAPRGGRKPTKRAKLAPRIIKKTTTEKPVGATHWSTRTLARALKIDKSMVQRVWAAGGLKPHLVRTFKVSNDPRFAEKLIDVVGLYLNPPEKALVLCADEKSQIQALDRTQPGLPLKKGRWGTYTHDYKRNGTTTLFAALDVLQGKVIGQCHPRHRHQEWLKFLRRLDDEYPAELTLHVVMDNYGTHKAPAVQAWLAKHSRFVCHFIPTSSSWLNMVERWFRELSEHAIRRGVFLSVPDLVKAIQEYLTAWNKEPRPFLWMAKVEDIMKKLDRARRKLEELKPGCTQPRQRKAKK